MIATVTNLSSTDPVDVPFPFNVTLAASGVAALGVNIADLGNGEEKGNPAWKQLNDMIKKKQITVTYANDTVSSDTLDLARRT